MSGNCELGRGLQRREKNSTKAGAGRFEKPAPDARAAPPEAHESLISWKTGAEVPLTGLSFGLPDADTVTGSQSDIFSHYGITMEGLADRVRSLRHRGRSE